jgi:hypothetical protein
MAAQLVQKFLIFCRTWMFVTVFLRSAQAQISLDTGIPSNAYSLILKSLPLVPILSQLNQANILTPYFFSSTLIVSSHLLLCRPCDLLHSGFQLKILYSSLSSLIHAICPAYLKVLVFLILIIMGKSTYYEAPHYEIWQCPVPLCNLGPNILLSTLCQTPLNLSFSLGETPSFTPRKKKK